MGLPRYPRLGFQGHTSSPCPLRIEHRIGGSGPTRRQQSGSRRCASVGSAAISNRPRTNRTEVGKAEMAHRWRGSTFFFFAERMTHRPTCQPLWRERLRHNHPRSQGLSSGKDRGKQSPKRTTLLHPPKSSARIAATSILRPQPFRKALDRPRKVRNTSLRVREKWSQELALPRKHCGTWPGTTSSSQCG